MAQRGWWSLRNGRLEGNNPFVKQAKPHRARGCVSAIDSVGRTIWIADAHRDDGKRFVVHADEKLSAFVGLEREALTVTFYLTSIHAGDF
jgi:hypothetical protein